MTLFTKIHTGCELFTFLNLYNNEIMFFSFSLLDEIVLSDFLSLSVDSSVPTFNPSSTDRQLMFKCKYYQNGSPILNDLLLDVKWEVNDVLFVEKYNLTLSQMQTEGRITKTDLTKAGITMGFNVRFQIIPQLIISTKQHRRKNMYFSLSDDSMIYNI